MDELKKEVAHRGAEVELRKQELQNEILIKVRDCHMQGLPYHFFAFFYLNIYYLYLIHFFLSNLN